MLAGVEAGIGREVHCASMFLSQNLHFVRLQRVLQAVVNELLDVKYSAQPEGAREYAECFRDFTIRMDGSYLVSPYRYLKEASKVSRKQFSFESVASGIPPALAHFREVWTSASHSLGEVSVFER